MKFIEARATLTDEHYLANNGQQNIFLALSSIIGIQNVNDIHFITLTTEAIAEFAKQNIYYKDIILQSEIEELNNE